MRNPTLLVVSSDPSLGEQVVNAGARVRPRPEVVCVQNLGAVGRAVEQHGPIDVVVAGPGTGTQPGFARLQTLRRQFPAMSVVLAFSERPRSSLRDIVRAGAVDLLKLPVNDEALAGALQRAVDMSVENASTGNQPLNGQASRPQEVGSVFTVASASGGAGKTFYATNLAYFLQSHGEGRVCLVDLDLQFGEVSSALRLRPRYTLADVVDRDEGEDDELARQIEEYITVHDSGVHVLAAPKDPAEEERVDAGDVRAVLEALRCRFEYVVVDTPPVLNEAVISALELSDQVHVLVTLDVPSLRNMSAFLKTLDQLDVPGDAIRLVLNKAERDLGVEVDQLVKLYPQGFFVELPYVREVTKSLNLGTPMLALNPGSVVSRKLEASLASLVPARAERVPGDRSAPSSRGLLSRLLPGSVLSRAGSS